LVGISGGLGMIAAILSPIVAGLILESTNSWDLIFNICCGALVFGGTFYLFFASSDKQFN
jgi:ACS family sodium-dependent inorganic phosphate cotransporter